MCTSNLTTFLDFKFSYLCDTTKLINKTLDGSEANNRLFSAINRTCIAHTEGEIIRKM